MTILYGQPTDPAAFRDYYENSHIPIARRMRGLTGWNLSWIDSDQTAPSPYILVAELFAESAEALDRVLASPEGVAAAEDLANFVTGTVDFLTGTNVEVPLS